MIELKVGWREEDEKVERMRAEFASLLLGDEMYKNLR